MTPLVIDKIIAFLSIQAFIFIGAAILWGITSLIQRSKPLFIRIRSKIAVAISWYFFPDIYKAYKGGYLEK